MALKGIANDCEETLKNGEGELKTNLRVEKKTKKLYKYILVNLFKYKIINSFSITYNILHIRIFFF